MKMVLKGWSWFQKWVKTVLKKVVEYGLERLKMVLKKVVEYGLDWKVEDGPERLTLVLKIIEGNVERLKVERLKKIEEGFELLKMVSKGWRGSWKVEFRLEND